MHYIGLINGVHYNSMNNQLLRDRKPYLSPVVCFISVIGLIVLTTLAVLLDIPVLRQILGLLLLTTLPGLLIIHLLKLHRLALLEKSILIIGLGPAFLMLFGLILNQVCLMVHYRTPFDTNVLIFVLSGVLTLLAIGSYVLNKEAFFSFPVQFELNKRGKWCLLLPFIFPLLAVLGAHSINTSDNNQILLALFFLIPICIVLITMVSQNGSAGTYSLTILMISISLLSSLWLRSEHIMGRDMHTEYYLFQMTMVNKHWQVITNSSLDACFSISVLPAIYQTILNMAAPEYLFKGIYVVLCSFSPLAVFIISKRYLPHVYAFLAALFFSFQSYFLLTACSARTNIAQFFFALFMMVLFDNMMPKMKRVTLLIIFMLAIIISHYTTTYIFLAVLFFMWLIGLTLNKVWPSSSSVTYTLIILCLALMFIWYAQLVESPFTGGILFVSELLDRFGYFFIAEARATEINYIMGVGMASKDFVFWLRYVVTWISFVLIAVGIIGTIIRSQNKSSTFVEGSLFSEFVGYNLNRNFLIAALVCCGILLVEVVTPYLSIGYRSTRVYPQLVVILATFFVMGGIIVSKYLRLNPRLLILLILIIYYISTTGLLQQITGQGASLALNPRGPLMDVELIHDQEIPAAIWLKEHAEENTLIYSTDYVSHMRLISQGLLPPDIINFTSFLERKTHGYLYLSYNNVVNNNIRTETKSYALDDYSSRLVGMNRIYSNGGSDIYK